MSLLQNEYKLEVSAKQKPLDNTTIAEDINRISLLLRKHLLGSKTQDLQVHVAVHQTQAESKAQQVLTTFNSIVYRHYIINLMSFTLNILY